MIGYRSDIDGLRAVAVVPVVLYHAGVPWMDGGYVGVDVFFVISGFLITSIIAPELEAGQFSLLRFYDRRARRILPALFFVLTLSIPAAWIMLLPTDFEAFSGALLATLGFVSNLWFWQTSTGYFAQASEFLPLLHTWSLAVEEQFYILYPIALAICMRWGRRSAVIAIGATILLSLMLAILATPFMPAASFYLLPTRAWELGLGALVALGVAPRRMNRTVREVLSAAALLAILLPIVLYNANTSFPGLAAIPPVFGAALLILIGTTGTSTVHRLLGTRGFVATGLISYSLYLCHWPVLAFFRVGIGDPRLPTEITAIAVCLSLVMSFLSWRYVERPFRVRLGSSVSSRTIASYSIGGLVLLSVVGGVILAGQGFPGRIAPEVLTVKAMARPTRFDLECARKYSLEDICRIGAPSAPGTPVDLVLIGDSHSAAVGEAVDVAAREAGLTGAYIGNASCAPLVGVIAGTPEHRENCRKFIEAATRFSRVTPGLRYVVLVSRWPVLVEGTLMPGEPGRPFPVQLDPEAFPDAPEAQGADAVRTALGATLDAFAAGGAEVLVLGPIPEIGWNVPDRMIAHLRWGTPMPSGPDLRSAKERQANAVDILETVVSTRSKATYIPVASELCTPVCPTHDGATAWYWDDDHLSPEGAVRWIAPLIRPHLAAR